MSLSKDTAARANFIAQLTPQLEETMFTSHLKLPAVCWPLMFIEPRNACCTNIVFRLSEKVYSFLSFLMNH